MDIFSLRQSLIHDYSSYVESFIHISDSRIQEKVHAAFQKGLLWPEPLLQLNPSFAAGQSIDALVEDGTLHQECKRIFRVGKTSEDPQGKELRLHRHQQDALLVAKEKANYVLTTGTGSGKSLSYIVPIVDHVLRRGPRQGIQALIIYPMNALANSQFGELEKFLCAGYPDGKGPISFAKYTGQEDDQKRQAILASPPDILLTNYVMLELIFTRPEEKKLVRAARGLRFLVLDELHTYRGRQGADVAMLLRRVREEVETAKLQCVGTSATLAGPGTYQAQQEEVAQVASKLFGSEVKPSSVIGETLQRATEAPPSHDFLVQSLRATLQDWDELPKQYNDFIASPLAIWVEDTFGLKREDDSGRFVRATPLGIEGTDGAARLLSQLTEVSEEICAQAIRQVLMKGYEIKHPETGRPVFAFRLHQFLSRGDTVYASIEAEDERYLTVHGQQYVPHDRERVLLPLVFCRECGQEYYCVRERTDDSGQREYLPRVLADNRDDEDGNAGFLFINTREPWPDDTEALFERLPEEWLEDHRGTTRVIRRRQESLPRKVYVDKLGRERDSGIITHYVSAPFSFCLSCGVTHGARQRSDFAKLSTLGSDGRSSATTLLCLSVLRRLREEESLSSSARKLLSFTDNRQDASLQAGHFNDFIEVGLLRSALFGACQKAGPEGLSHEKLTQEVFDTLGLPLSLYAVDPMVRFEGLTNTQKALRNVLGYRLYLDLRRGWRITLPNLEQCGLLEISYSSLKDVCEAEDIWEQSHPALSTASPDTRMFVCKTLLDLMRRELAVRVDYLSRGTLDRIEQESSQHLVSPWAFDENETLEYASVMFPRAQQKKDFRSNLFVGPRSGFGLFLRRSSTFPELQSKISLDETTRIIQELLEGLRIAGIVQVVESKAGEVSGYQVAASAMRWKAGDGSAPFHDTLRVSRRSEEGGRTNPFFVEFYRSVAHLLLGLEAREHTAQVPYHKRLEREQLFRQGKLQLLFCSPTMELGVDIAELNVVNLRNIPPTPANYAQRSGRAGRSGQPALVFAYCSGWSPHDQFFFKRPQAMVAGAVAPPRLELANEDLLKAHVHAVWLSEVGISLGTSLGDVLDVGGTQPTLELRSDIRAGISLPAAVERAKKHCDRVFQSIQQELEDAPWYHEEWLNSVLQGATRAFEQACERWKALYRTAQQQRDVQHELLRDTSHKGDARRIAESLRREAETQLSLLTQSGNLLQSDFYSYRYFASEGFLPGYNFPRLPLSAYIPGKRKQKRDGEYLLRPRFLAIYEFGPQALIYHEGARYIVNKAILPISDDGPHTASGKQCEQCGYFHPEAQQHLDLCVACHTKLPAPLQGLFRLDNAATKRRDRINSDEEERLRQGYELKTAFRFAQQGKRSSTVLAELKSQAGVTLWRLTYAHAATLLRMNLGRARRRDKNIRGFLLDTENGYWKGEESGNKKPNTSDPQASSLERVIPYVEDTRNCLLLEPDKSLDLGLEEMASLQAALKNAIQVHFQLEENELASEPLPSILERNLLLFYESSEGGAGILKQLVESPHDFTQVLKQALSLCHFDPETGEDQHRAPNAPEDCEAACYDCLMSYGNQRDHLLLDRSLIRDLLLEMAQMSVVISPTEAPRDSHLEQLLRLCDSDLEKRWLRYLEEKGYNLPTKAQTLIDACKTRPDFLYEGSRAAIYIDGPHHDFPERQKRDAGQEQCLEDRGYIVLRFAHNEDWDNTLKSYALSLEREYEFCGWVTGSGAWAGVGCFTRV